MKKKLILGLVLAFAMIFGANNTFAAQINNLKIVPTTSELSIQWDLLSENDSLLIDGYALQWSLDQNDIKIDQHPRQTISKSKNYLSVRAADFARNTKYYFRVYAYTKNDRGRGYNLFNGSQILEWEWKSNSEVETRYITPSDPVVNTVEESATFNFGQLRVVPFDQSATLSWSRANLASHEYTGSIITISEKADLSDPVYELKTGKSIFKGFIEGLTPEKKYYAAGYFYKKENGQDRKFGRGTIVPFTMDKKFTTTQQQRYERTLSRLKRNGIGATGRIGGATSTTNTSKNTANLTKKSEIESRIKELEAEIRAKQKELSSLKSKLRSLFGTTTTTKTTSKKSKRRTSLRERLLKKLNR